jgi:hypothetical protein
MKQLLKMVIFIKEEKMKRRKVFVFTKELPGIKRIPFENLKKGNIFYTEEPDGELTVDELKNGKPEFLYQAMSKVKGHTLNDLCVEVQPAMEE